jgi:hypothetical protein
VTQPGIVWALLLAAAATPAGAATVCVNPRGTTGCRTTIQAAVDAAAAGDVVAVQAGVYSENVEIPSGKEGLQIVGTSRLATILDPDAPNAGVGITISADRVTLRNFTIRNGRSHGIVIARSDAVVQGLRIVGIRGGAGIFAVAGAGRLRVLGNEIRSTSGAGIQFDGGNADSVIQGNVIAQTSGDGIVATAARLTIASNRIFSVRGRGIAARSDGSTVSGNLIENSVEAGVELEGSSAVLDSNRAVATQQAFLYTCFGCDGSRVQRNTSVGARDVGFSIDSQPGGQPGLIVQGNSATDSRFSGFLLKGTQMQASSNTSSGSGLGAGFAITGADHVVSRNTATRSTGAGFEVSADRVQLEANVASQGDTNGFLVVGSNGPSAAHADNVLTGNRALRTNGQGFGVVTGAQHSVLSGNFAANDRLDFCDEGVNTDSAAGNSFTTRSAHCAIVF